MEDQNIYSFKLEVDKEERLDKLLTNYFIEYSRSTIQKWIASNHVKIDGKICNQKDIIKNSCNVSIYLKSNPEVQLIAEDIKIDVIEETADFIIVNKASGMVTHIAPGNYSGTLQNALFYRYPELANVPRTGIIHRLDKETSGILVISRNLSSHNYLNQQLQEQKFDKTYHALVCGAVSKNIRIDEPIGRHPVNRKKMSVKFNGKPALSIIKPLKSFDYASHIEVKIITGRTHQIRVHMSHINRPVIGDRLYGYNKNIFQRRLNIYEAINQNFGQYLHAYSLSFSDPTTKKIRKYKADYPKEYYSLLKEMNKKIT